MSLVPLRRVVVTGMGAITPVGNTLTESWKRALDNTEPGVTTLEHALLCQSLPEEQLERELQAARALPCQVAAPVQCGDDDYLTHDTRTPRFVQMALRAAREALEQAELLLQSSSDGDKDTTTSLIPSMDPDRIGVCIGSGMSGVREIVEAARMVETRGLRRLSPHFVPKVLANTAAGRVSLEFGLRGPNHAVSTACAAGTHALGDAARCIQYNNADIIVAGGAEACIDPLSLAGFTRLKALSTNFTQEPTQSSRPFDQQRDGFVMGEGAAVLVLEELEHAKARQAPILAELCGYGLTGDAFHVTAPHPDGLGAGRAMQMALTQAAHGMESLESMEELLSRVGYVNAHATSTPKGDEIEAKCIDRIFSKAATTRQQHPLFVSSTKGATGHLLGAAGAIEAAFTVLALVHQEIPPTCNLENIDDEAEEPLHGFQHVRGSSARVKDMEFAMSNSFGFGGTNASIILKRWDPSTSH
ncbi:3-oxoacyl-[acyl-carrier-protein] synthase 2 (Fragment) [Seminavis robusta]|uniref:beta-ketoacyl-[acyl-carrier-protein] synthase I n=1 Tax=Seminavis robusta TaxID=568900 RepID=A0A9N8DFZ5_9STRA